ncbi:MAG: SpoIIE family protein phosphatase [Pseudomonadota bacterium]
MSAPIQASAALKPPAADPLIAEKAPFGLSRALPPGKRGRVLVVDDSRTQRLRLAALLSKQGFTVSQAGDGAEALAWLRENPSPLVLSDWMMPGLTGPELCRALREAEGEDHYTYFVMLTAKAERHAVFEGLEAGADDFLSKPVNEDELIARLHAGMRVMVMQEGLRQGRTEIASAFNRLKSLHDALERDLAVAALLQREILPPPLFTCHGAQVATYYTPAGHVGGDLVGCVAAEGQRVLAYGIDVSGHGVAAALMVARLAQFFAPGDPSANIAFERHGNAHRLRPPEAIMHALNARCLGTGLTDVYVTAALASIDLTTGEGLICRGGYAEPAVVSPTGAVRFLEQGGMPLGIFEEIEMPTEPFTLAPGERLVLSSDGLTETTRPDGSMLGEAGLATILADLATTPVAETLPALVARVAQEAGGKPFDDDVSALLLERPPG